jgi:hypothetical protein
MIIPSDEIGRRAGSNNCDAYTCSFSATLEKRLTTATLEPSGNFTIDSFEMFFSAVYLDIDACQIKVGRWMRHPDMVAASQGTIPAINQSLTKAHAYFADNLTSKHKKDAVWTYSLSAGLAHLSRGLLES